MGRKPKYSKEVKIKAWTRKRREFEIEVLKKKEEFERKLRSPK